MNNNMKKNNKILEFKHNLNVSNKIAPLKLKAFLMFIFLSLSLLIVRIAFLQFIDGKKLK